MITPWLGGILCIVAIFSPSFFLLIGILPFWQSIRDLAWMIAALKGINAAVVGLLLAALYQPIWTNSIYTSKDFSLALLALLALMVWRLPVWLVVFLGVF
ncbi:chromate transporter [Acinetobacter soli]|nr:chromate transporter [Acinetobacter soli]WEI01247.1 chromate transporter [Acinetobacter soli]